jgi:hypothetical protein
VILCRDLVESARDRFLSFPSDKLESSGGIDGTITAACVIFVSLNTDDDVYIK